jgi:hypothetical protein
VAAGEAGQLRTSTDAITWVTRTSTFGTTAIEFVAFGGGLFVAVGGGATVRSSSDGITWDAVKSPKYNTVVTSIPSAGTYNAWVKL